MTKTVAFHLQKGGVGKTTISGTLACQSALDGKKTLIVDCDPQGNVSSWFLQSAPKFELADVLQGKCFVADAIVKAPGIENLFILPTFGIGGSLKSYSETKLSEEPFVIQDLINQVAEDYDHIIMDLSPGLGMLERYALIASDEVITPMTSEVFSHIYAAAMESGNYKVYLIPVDPIFRKSQEAGKAPQNFKVRGRGMKEATNKVFEELYKDIWK